MYKSYQHVERFGTIEVEGIENGTCYVFDKLDGTNAKLWYDGCVRFGSRNRELIDDDNAGFKAAMSKDPRIISFYEEESNRKYVLFGEWLVKHSIKDYLDSAWRKFYIFDVMIEDSYVPYEEYKPLLDKYSLDYIPAYNIVNPDVELLKDDPRMYNYLMKDGCKGEGFVIKNYDFVNRFGRTTWAKVVRAEFKSEHRKFKVDSILQPEVFEEKILNRDVVNNLIEKTYAKISNDKFFSSKCIPELLGRVWSDFLAEEIRDIVIKSKNPTINFKVLNNLVISMCKEFLKEKGII